MQARGGRPTAFLTLTVNPDVGGSPEERARSLVWLWRTIVQCAKIEYEYSSVPFLAVFETTKRGEPHLHILARCKWLDQAWLSRKAEAFMGAPIVHIRRVKERNKIAAYIAKYIGKAPQRFGTCKRYWTSRDYEECSKSEWKSALGEWTGTQIRRCSVFAYVETVLEEYFTVDWEGDAAIVRPRAPG